MQISGIAELPLHGGKCPKRLFPLMVNLSQRICELIVDEYGEKELLRRLSDPYWFQAFGCVLGFDWHSSGLTTTTTGALKEALKNTELGIGVAGGKGKASRKTPEEIMQIGDKLNLNEKKLQKLIKASKLAAKVDNSLLQDGFNLYHHSFFFTKNSWCIVQQGMSEDYARRYHWLSSNLKNFLNEPHSAIVCDKKTKPLNLVAKEVRETQKCSVDLVRENPIHLKKYLTRKKFSIAQKKLFEFNGFSMPRDHFPEISADLKVLMEAYEKQPRNYEELVLIKGMGQKNLRALALISHLIYGTPLSWKDPVKYSFAHGGKDGWPYPVNKEKYRESIEFLKQAVQEARIGHKEKIKALKRIDNFYRIKV